MLTDVSQVQPYLSQCTSNRCVASATLPLTVYPEQAHLVQLNVPPRQPSDHFGLLFGHQHTHHLPVVTVLTETRHTFLVGAS